jgi:hypothetical protein
MVDHGAMSSRSRAWLPLVVGGLGLALLAALFLASRDERPAPRAEAHEAEPPIVPAPAPERRANRAAEVQEARAEEPRVAEQEPAPAHAHPLTIEHARLYRDVDLLEAAKDALARRDFATARAILAQHRVEFPKGYPERVEGYEIIADCLENPGPETTARARQYHEEKRASVVRRQVRKACLTPPS